MDNNNRRRRRIKYAVWTAVLVLLVGLSVTVALGYRHYVLISLVAAALSMAPFFLRFERKRAQARELVLIAMLAALAVVSRIAFAPLPNVKPVTFVIIVCALVFGAESGFMIGAVTAIVSNLFFGQGPWTPWQMLAWGMVGFSAGLLGKQAWLQHRVALALFGFAWGFLYGWIMDIYVVAELLSTGGTWREVAVKFVASFYFDLAHALTNAVLLFLFGAMWLKILRRYKTKIHGAD